MNDGKRIDGKAAHRVQLGSVKLPCGDTVETVEFLISTPMGDLSLHMSPSVAADMAVELSRIALDVAKREQAREMSEHIDILDMIREVLEGHARDGAARLGRRISHVTARSVRGDAAVLSALADDI